MIRVVLADDHYIFREGFKSLLDKQTEIILVGEAETGLELIQAVEKLEPDIVITDIQMPGLTGIEAAKRIRLHSPKIGIIAISMYTENSMIIDMLKAGARGYLSKNTGGEELALAIRTVYEGETYFSADTSPGMTKLIDKNNLNPFHLDKGVKLSEKEINIIQLICQEYSSKQIAPQVDLTKRTVDSYREKIQQKIGAQNVVGIVLYAIRNGLFILE